MLCLQENDTRVSNLELLNQPEMENDPVTVAFESAKLRIFLYIKSKGNISKKPTSLGINEIKALFLERTFTYMAVL